MSILTSSPNQPLPKEVQLLRQANNVKQFSKTVYDELTKFQKRGIDMVWNHPQLSPQEIIDELGTDAIKVFQYHGALTEYLVTLATTEGLQPDISLPLNAFIVNPQTGVITVTEDPYVP